MVFRSSCPHCAPSVTVTWLQFNAQLLRLLSEARFAEQLEHVIYNQLCGAQQPDGRAWGYYVQMEGKKPYTSTLDGQCCLSSGPRGFALVPTFAVTTDVDGVVVNMYDAGDARLALRDGTAVQLAIDTAYPAADKISMHVNPAEAAEFAVKLRIPEWCAKSDATLRVNNEATPITCGRDGYAIVRRYWNSGDTIVLTLPQTTHVIVGDHKNQGKIAVLYGPLVLAADAAFLGLELHHAGIERPGSVAIGRANFISQLWHG